ncbi:MAG: type II toxin-antitoxin system HipA family toxin [Lentisphaerae bacterium]|jgi:serine/threonine-protein kinase HipA|nr:type II toxin-antitoxin system HipA family toxin [Verrucomicrobiota bacterium]MBT7060352.1 type II toxin-antitoxin system HipA family toxin [Lentisphaerota bacterium]MBT7701488.1 type II toxin-antitoxin system HipA family toxin [Verrucomicrobiota bacterium]
MKKLDVYLATSDASDRGRLVGTLAASERRLFFEYDADFLDDPLWLSPFKLPPERGLHEHRDLAFGPLFGLFDDSLPDGWGLLLMDRYFRRQGVLLDGVSPLDRLAYLGRRTMGALTYYPPAEIEESDRSALDLHDMAREAYQVLEGKGEEVLPQLLRAGGSPGGARPKVLVGVRGDQMISGEDDLPEGYAGWLVKFPASDGASEEGRIEYAYSEMARAAGVKMPQTSLFMTAQGDAFFGVERFDRQGNERRHVHTFGNLIHSNFRVPCCDYEMLLRVTRILTKNQSDALCAFRLMVFNILAHNRDDHVKNFAFVLGVPGDWRFAPAYDLTFAAGPGGEHTMTVAGEGRRPSLAHVLTVAQGAGIEAAQARAIVDEVAAAVADWRRFADAAGIPAREVRRIEQAFCVLQ